MIIYHTPMISRAGRSQLLRRVVSVVVLSTALISIGAVSFWWVAALLLAAAATYGLWPNPPQQPGDLRMRQGPAVIVPDLLGLSLTGFFVALPIWIGRAEGTGGVHGAAAMIWIMALGSSTLLLIGASGSCLRLRIEADGLVLARLRGQMRVQWSEIAAWARWRRGLPKVLRLLAPFLSPGAAGAVLLARDSNGVELRLKDGRLYRLPREGFEHGEAQLVQALAAHGVPQKTGRAK